MRIKIRTANDLVALAALAALTALAACSVSSPLGTDRQRRELARPGEARGAPACPEGTTCEGPERAPAQVAAAPSCPDGTELRDGACAEPSSGSLTVAAAPPFEPRAPLQPARELRASVLHPRAANILKAELQALTVLYEATPRDAPDRRSLLRRLAEGYSALARVDWRAEAAARRRAILYYGTLAEDYKTSCASPTDGCADEALYYMGLEQEVAGKVVKAGKSYQEIIRNYPQSPFYPYAFFAHTEIFFEHFHKVPPTWYITELSYQKVLQFSDSRVAPEALIRLAQIAELKGDAEEAEQHYEKLRKMYPAAAKRAPAPPRK
jgi:tetratricopeptide (TPR) repeat protein